MNPTIANTTIIQEIVIKAPAERIFEASTNPAQRTKWWGPKGDFRLPMWSLTCAPAESG